MLRQCILLFFKTEQEVQRGQDVVSRGVMLSREQMRGFIIRCEQRTTVVANLTVTMGKRPDCALCTVDAEEVGEVFGGCLPVLVAP
jgi:hypothetical protein